MLECVAVWTPHSVVFKRRVVHPYTASSSSSTREVDVKPPFALFQRAVERWTRDFDNVI